MKKIKYTDEEWIERLSKDLPDEYQIGLHQIGVFSTPESKKEIHKRVP